MVTANLDHIVHREEQLQGKMQKIRVHPKPSLRLGQQAPFGSILAFRLKNFFLEIKLLWFF